MILDYSLFQITSRMIWLECIVFKTVLTINAACRLIICQLEMPQKMTISDKSVSSVFIGNNQRAESTHIKPVIIHKTWHRLLQITKLPEHTHKCYSWGRHFYREQSSVNTTMYNYIRNNGFLFQVSQ